MGGAITGIATYIFMNRNKNKVNKIMDEIMNKASEMTNNMTK